MIDLDAIRKRHAAATPGPWIDDDPEGIRHAEPNIYAGQQEIADAYNLANSELIAHAPADIADLLAIADAACAYLRCLDTYDTDPFHGDEGATLDAERTLRAALEGVGNA